VTCIKYIFNLYDCQQMSDALIQNSLTNRNSGIGRRKQRGGGVILVYKDGKRLSFSVTPSTFELLGAQMTFASSALIIIAVYRPGGDPVNSQFFDELAAVLEQLATYSCPIVVTGDLNLHLDVTDSGNTRRLQELLDTFGLCQFVSTPTHRDGHTLDVVITRADLSPPVIEVRPSDEFSDLGLFCSSCHCRDLRYGSLTSAPEHGETSRMTCRWWHK